MNSVQFPWIVLAKSCEVVEAEQNNAKHNCDWILLRLQVLLTWPGIMSTPKNRRIPTSVHLGCRFYSTVYMILYYQIWFYIIVLDRSTVSPRAASNTADPLSLSFSPTVSVHFHQFQIRSDQQVLGFPEGSTAVSDRSCWPLRHCLARLEWDPAKHSNVMASRLSQVSDPFAQAPGTRNIIEVCLAAFVHTCLHCTHAYMYSCTHAQHMHECTHAQMHARMHTCRHTCIH